MATARLSSSTSPKSLIPNGDQAPGADETAVKYQAHCVTEMIQTERS
jgi:hypothetical protein